MLRLLRKGSVKSLFQASASPPRSRPLGVAPHPFLQSCTAMRSILVTVGVPLVFPCEDVGMKTG